MANIKFRCRLLSDVIFHKQSTVGQLQRTTDYIPGNTFLGILAKKYDTFSMEQQMTLFHSGMVRFGDAHPVSSNGSIRSLRIPAAMYYPKLKGMEGGCYIHHIYNRQDDHEDSGAPQQLKQCRSGFYVFNKERHTMSVVSLDKTLSLKSAYDRERRASEDGKMYINESLRAGATFLFEVETDEEGLETVITEGLSGIHFIGHSRTAQFGRVLIEPFDYNEIPSSDKVAKEGEITIYADGRLIFLDANGAPTFRPTAAQLGVNGGTIDWSKSQIRTFQYAPWNGKRYCYDTDRCGIEKGSVFVVHTDSVPTGLTSHYVGCYQNEGFGKVIYNPDFLQTSSGTNGQSLYKIEELPTTPDEQPAGNHFSGTLINYLFRRQKRAIISYCYEQVNFFVKTNFWAYFDDKEDKSDTFSSQWGEIREIVQRKDTVNSILSGIDSYISDTDFRKRKWNENRRYDKLKKFIKEIDDYVTKEVGKDDSLVKETLTNLATEMGKKNREHKNKQK